MTNILIVTDNVPIFEYMKSVFQRRNRPDLTYEFKCSNRQSPVARHADKISQINVKNRHVEIADRYDLVISGHCQQFFPRELVNSVRCINIHPGYNPITRGWYPQIFSIIEGIPIGATIHEMDEKLDNGAIIARELVTTYEWDTSLTIYNRVLEAEMRLFESNFDCIIDNIYEKTTPEQEGKLYLKKDFAALCELDMNKTGTSRNFTTCYGRSPTGNARMRIS